MANTFDPIAAAAGADTPHSIHRASLRMSRAAWHLPLPSGAKLVLLSILSQTELALHCTGQRCILRNNLLEFSILHSLRGCHTQLNICDLLRNLANIFDFLCHNSCTAGN